MKIVTNTCINGNRLEFELPFDPELLGGFEYLYNNDYGFTYNFESLTGADPYPPVEIEGAYMVATITNKRVYISSVLHVNEDTAAPFAKEYIDCGELDTVILLTDSEMMQFLIKLIKHDNESE